VLDDVACCADEMKLRGGLRAAPELEWTVSRMPANEFSPLLQNDEEEEEDDKKSTVRYETTVFMKFRVSTLSPSLNFLIFARFLYIAGFAWNMLAVLRIVLPSTKFEGLSVFRSVWNLFNDVLTPTILTIPAYLVQAGIFPGMALTLIFGIISFATLMVAHHLAMHKNFATYPQMCYTAFGLPGYLLSSLFIFLFNFGTFTALHCALCARCALCGDFCILMDLRFAHMHEQFSHLIIRSFESLSPL
jgi:hypothetical protein